jgi:xanthine/uracil/vitamin C permease (AzgA family)
MSHSAGTEGQGERDIAAEKAAAQDKADARNAGGGSSKLFDLRFLIGGLFTLYGVMVGGAGLFDSSADLQKSDGVRINLWTGLGMLVLGLLFLFWAFARPVQHAAKEEDDK